MGINNPQVAEKSVGEWCTASVSGSVLDSHRNVGSDGNKTRPGIPADSVLNAG